jgi:Ni,Fe-hydrogenase I large subunit
MAIPDSIKKLQMKFQFRTEATLGGVKFVLQVLSFKDEQKAQALPTENMDGLVFFNEMQKSMLSYAIRSVDGEEIPDTISETGPDGKEISKERPIYVREILDGLPHKVIESLFDVYVDLREQKEQEIGKSLTYSWYKTPEQREKENKDREKKAEEEAKEKEKKEMEALASKLSVKAPAANAVPSPDAEINFVKLPDDHGDESPAPKV